MKTRRFAANSLDREDDWRASYHLSAAAVLSEKGDSWHKLQEFAPQCLEGWRVSTNPSSLAYDARIDTTPAYRMRHVRKMTLETDSDHWQPPQISGEPFCVQRFDVLVRKVGEVQAALVLPSHGQHPADGNLGIIRGLPSEQAVWLCWCINQPLYKAYLENTDTFGTLIRLGLKRLKQMPIAHPPEAFKPLAQSYIESSESLAEANLQLSLLRTEVTEYMAEWQTGLEQEIGLNLTRMRSQWFRVADIGSTWLMPYTEQRSLARHCIEAYDGQPITDVARINPVATQNSTQHSIQQPDPHIDMESGTGDIRSLRIRDLDNQMGIPDQLEPIENTAWRFRSYPLQKYDVLVSTFAQDSKVGFMERHPEHITRPSEQLITLAFHKHQGAYALIMETPFVKSQLIRLASGTVQKFIPPALVNRLVLPPVNEQTAARWHRHLVTFMSKATEARKKLTELESPMGKKFDIAHQYSATGTSDHHSLY